MIPHEAAALSLIAAAAGLFIVVIVVWLGWRGR